MNPINFAPIPASGALTIGAGVANGLENAVNNFAKMRMQKAQMENANVNANAQRAYQQARAEQMRRQNLSSDIQKVRLAQAYMSLGDKKGEDISGLKKAAQPFYERILANVKPEEANAMRAHIEQQLNQGQIPSEISEQVQLNPNEQRIYESDLTNQTRRNNNETSAEAKKYSADAYAASRVKVAQTSAHARTATAGSHAGTSPQTKADLQAMNNLNTQIKLQQQLMADVDKPRGFTDARSDHDKMIEKQPYVDSLAKLTDKYWALHDGLGTSAPQPSSQQPAPMSPLQGAANQQSPQYLPWGQMGQAQPGNIVVNPAGHAFQKTTGGWIPANTQASPAMAAPTQQAPSGSPGQGTINNSPPPTLPTTNPTDGGQY